MVRSQKSIGGVVGVAVGKVPYKIGSHSSFYIDLHNLAMIVFLNLLVLLSLVNRHVEQTLICCSGVGELPSD